jgi:hypothetical protein
MLEPIRIIRDAYYDGPSATIALGIGETSLARARRSGALRHVRRGGRIMYKGEWLDEWLSGTAGDGRDRETAAGRAAAP